MAERICVLLAPGYEEVEALTPVDYLRRAGLNVDIISTIEEISVMSAHDVIVQADTFLEDIKPEDYNMIVIPGGVPGAPNLAANNQVLDFIREMDRQEKYIAALCAGPMVLDRAGVLTGKKATCFPGYEKELPTAGTVLEDTVVVDGRIITSRGAGAAGYFALALVEALVGKEKADEVKKAVVMDIVEENLGCK